MKNDQHDEWTKDIDTNLGRINASHLNGNTRYWNYNKAADSYIFFTKDVDNNFKESSLEIPIKVYNIIYNDICKKYPSDGGYRTPRWYEAVDICSAMGQEEIDTYMLMINMEKMI